MTLPKLSKEYRNILESRSWDFEDDFICCELTTDSESTSQVTAIMSEYWYEFKPYIPKQPEYHAFIHKYCEDTYAREDYLDFIVPERKAFVGWLLKNY